MERTDRWKKMRYGMGESGFERHLAVLLISVCASMVAREGSR